MSGKLIYATDNTVHLKHQSQLESEMNWQQSCWFLLQKAFVFSPQKVQVSALLFLLKRCYVLTHIGETNLSNN